MAHRDQVPFRKHRKPPRRRVENGNRTGTEIVRRVYRVVGKENREAWGWLQARWLQARRPPLSSTHRWGGEWGASCGWCVHAHAYTHAHTHLLHAAGHSPTSPRGEAREGLGQRTPSPE